MAEKSTAFIGAGNMGGVLLERVCTAMDPARITITRRDREKGRAQAAKLGCVWADSIVQAVRGADYVLLCVKPQDLMEVLEGILPTMREAAMDNRRQVLVSIAAGVPLREMEDRLAAAGLDVPVIRVMPSTPAAVGSGLLFLTPGSRAVEEDISALEKLLTPCGTVERVTEGQLEMGGTLAGCGPAFVYLFIEALADGGVQIGLPRAQAQRWAAQTALGAAKMVLQTGQHPGALKDAVCSPGGSTIAGVEALERHAFRHAAAQAVVEAYRRFNG